MTFGCVAGFGNREYARACVCMCVRSFHRHQHQHHHLPAFQGKFKSVDGLDWTGLNKDIYTHILDAISGEGSTDRDLFTLTMRYCLS